MHLSRLKWCLIDSARRAESEYVSLNKKYVNAVLSAKSTQLSGTWTVVQEIASEEGYNHIYIYIDDKYILLVPTSGTSICFKFEIRSENRHSTYLTPSFYVTEMYLTTRMVT